MALERASLRRATGGTRRLFGPDQALVLLRAAWPAAVGADVARRTEVIALERGTLRIRVPDAGWRKVLHRMRGPILSRLGAVAGDLAPRNLGFLEASMTTALALPTLPPLPDGLATSSDPTPTRPASHGAPANPAAPEPVPAPLPPPSVTEAAQAIADPDVRARFLASAGLYLDRHPAAPR